MRNAQVTRSLVVAVCASLFGLRCASATPLEVVPGEYLIEPALAQATIQSTLSAASAGSVGDLRIKRVFATTGAVLLAPKTLAATTGDSAEYVPYDPRDPVCKRLIAQHLAKYCEPNFKVQASELPNDPQFGSLWGLSAVNGIRASSAWDVSKGSSDVVVAVIDTGLDYRHPDLAANVWTNSKEIPDNGIDDDGDGVVDDVHGYNAASGSGDPFDDNSHGTHVSGTIGALGNNSVGVVGINWHVRIMPIKFLDSNGSGSIASAIQAIDYMITMKQRGVNIKVANNSWGGPGYSQALFDAIQRANDAGIVFVAAAGNEANDNDASPAYPASYELPNVVSVAAVDENGNLASFSNYGASTVDIGAPGVHILSTVPNGQYASYSGTSMATPHVTGALALLQSVSPELSSAELIQRLYDSASPSTSLRSVTRTGRMLNAGRLLHNEIDPLPAPPPDPVACPYAAEISAAPVDHSADAGTILMDNIDEFNFKTVSLPFFFPFDGQNVSRVTVSPNGVLYMGQNSDMDWQNASIAPKNSIGALHSDLTSTVRTNVRADSATFYWHSSVYTNPGAGTADIRLTLHADGSAEEWISFSSGEIQKMLQNSGTVGLNGHRENSAVTFAFNDSKIRDGLALLWAPQCGGAPQTAHLKTLRLWGINAGGVLSARLSPGESFRLQLVGAALDGTGPVTAQVKIGSTTCSQNLTLQSVSNRPTTYRGRLSRSLARAGARSLEVSTPDGAPRATRPIELATGRAKLALSSPRVASACASLVRSLKRVK